MDVTRGSSEDMVREVWVRVRPSAAEKVARLAEAAERLADGTLDDDLRADAWQQAHRLAGSLGSFGFADGSVAAAEAEAILEGVPDVADAPALARAVARMQQVVAED